MDRPALVFACAHLCDERLYAPQIEVLKAPFEIRVFAFRRHDTLAAMAAELLAQAPPRFTMIGLSLGGYVAMEVLRQAPARVARLVLMDTRADGDTPERLAGRQADIAQVREQGMAALAARLPGRWLHPDQAARPQQVALLAAMAQSIGAQGQFNQQQAIMGRPDSHADLRRVRVPTLLVCGREDRLTPPAAHEAMRDCIPGARLELVERCGHLATIEQPQAVTDLLCSWLDATAGAA